VTAQLALAALLAIAAVVVAALLRRRHRTDAPTQPAFTVPTQLARTDFARPEADWLVVVFSSATCTSCGPMVDKARALASDAVAVDDVEATARRDLHERYHIDAVPVTVLADRDGVVRASFLGPASATDLWAAVAAARGES
jgi:hypothetical protein